MACRSEELITWDTTCTATTTFFDNNDMIIDDETIMEVRSQDDCCKIGLETASPILFMTNSDEIAMFDT